MIFSVYIKTMFADEILNTRKRIIDYAKIPFQNEEKRKPTPAPVSSDTLISGTQTSSFVSVKGAAPEETASSSFELSKDSSYAIPDKKSAQEANPAFSEQSEEVFPGV